MVFWLFRFVNFLDIYSVSFKFCSPVLVFVFIAFYSSKGFGFLPSFVISYKIVLIAVFVIINLTFFTYFIRRFY